MKRKFWIVAAAGMLLGGSALAVKSGGTLYIKAKGTKVLKSPTSSTAVATLNPGDTVTWVGADPSNKQFHKVTTSDNKAGVVLQSNLSPNAPSKEMVASGGGAEVDPQAFASSGAATKAMSESAVEYANAGGQKKAAADLVVMEQIAKDAEGGAK
jgi:hypothetical protein